MTGERRRTNDSCCIRRPKSPGSMRRKFNSLGAPPWKTFPPGRCQRFWLPLLPAKCGSHSQIRSRTSRLRCDAFSSNVGTTGPMPLDLTLPPCGVPFYSRLTFAVAVIAQRRRPQHSSRWYQKLNNPTQKAPNCPDPPETTATGSIACNSIRS
jgi:hypothetical protein